MNVDFTKNYSEDYNAFEFSCEGDRLDFNNESYSNDLFNYNNFSSKMNSPNYISYETNEEFIENFLKIGNAKNEKSSKGNKKLSEVSRHNKTTTKESQNDSISTLSSSRSNNNNNNNCNSVTLNNNSNINNYNEDLDANKVNLRVNNFVSLNENNENYLILNESEIRMPYNNCNNYASVCENLGIKGEMGTSASNDFNLIGNKKGRPMIDKNVIYDEGTNRFYDPETDYSEYKKARKRMQNRESAIRSRQKKKENFKSIEADMDYIKMENIKLKQENDFLKNEKVFLVDQIKFMQNLIKSHNLVLVSNTLLTVQENSNLNLNNQHELNLKLNNENENFNNNNYYKTNSKNDINDNINNQLNKKNYDIEKNIICNGTSEISSNNSNSQLSTKTNNSKNTKNLGNHESTENNCENTKQIYLNGKNQKKIGKVFSIFIICLLSVFYVSTADFGPNEKIVFNQNSIMNLNEYNETANGSNNRFTQYSVYLFHLLILLLLVLLYFPVYLVVRWFMKYICGYFKQKKVKFVKNL